MLSAYALKKFCELLSRNIYLARYKIGTEYQETLIESVNVYDDGRVIASFSLNMGTVENVTEVKIFDRSGNLWIESPENIQPLPGEEAVLYKMLFYITEE